MKRIFKYRIPTNVEHYHVDLPVGAKVLTVDVQNDEPFIWVLLDDSERMTVTRRFSFYATGQRILDDALGTYIGSVQIFRIFMFHLFEDVMHEDVPNGQ